MWHTRRSEILGESNNTYDDKVCVNSATVLCVSYTSDVHLSVQTHYVFHNRQCKSKLSQLSRFTNPEITAHNAPEIAWLARTQWNVENLVFNALKIQGYHLEHNYGQGKKYLSSTLIGLTHLTFLCDQVQEYGCVMFNAARQKFGTNRNLWAKLQRYSQDIERSDRGTLRLLAGGGLKLQIIQTDDME